jgi:hypothetical protein
MKITLLHPSRGRAEKAHETYLYWMENSSPQILEVQVEIEHILSIDTSDPQVEQYKKLFGVTSTVIVNDNDCVVKATNHAAKLATGDILIYLSDDFMCPKDWDLLLVEKFKGVETPMMLRVDDLHEDQGGSGIQGIDIAVLRIPITNRALYQKLGYFWFPEYRSLFVDEDLFWTCNNNGWLVKAPELKFEHLHWCNGKAPIDATYQATEKNWEQGKALYAKRSQENFPLING